MKVFFTVAAVAVVGASAQTITSSSNGTVIVTEYYTDCATETSGIATAVGTVMETHCPDCKGEAATAPAGPLTTYTTVYSETCSTGLQAKTYTITEACSSTGAPRAPEHIPSAFVVTTVTCHVCGETPLVATLTTPAPVPASAAPGGGAPAIAPASPTAVGKPPTIPSPGESSGNPPPSPGSPAGPAGAAVPPKNGSPAPPPGGASPQSGGSPGSAPAPAGKAVPAPYYPAPSTGILPTGGSKPGSSSVVPFTGGASKGSIGTCFTTFAMVIAVALAVAR